MAKGTVVLVRNTAGPVSYVLCLAALLLLPGSGHHQSPGQHLPRHPEGEVALAERTARLPRLPGCQLLPGQQLSSASSAPGQFPPHHGLELRRWPEQNSAGQPRTGLLHPSPSHTTPKGEHVTDDGPKHEWMYLSSVCIYLHGVTPWFI